MIIISNEMVKTFFAILIFSGFVHPVWAANRYWVSAVSSNWNNISNWSLTSGGAGGSSVPGSADAVIFDNSGNGNCTIDLSVNITSLTLNATYSGNITQGSNPISVTTTAIFSGGSFSGGTANIFITGGFTLSGCSFASTAGILELRDNAAFLGGTFLHNNGTVRFNATNTTTQTMSGISPTFYILEFVGISRPYTIASIGNITVLNSLNFSGVSYYNLFSGTIDLSGDINISNTSFSCGGDAQVNINGTGNQNYNGGAAAGQGALPKLTINKSSGILNLFNYPSVENDFTYSAGTVNPGTSTFCFTHGTVGTYTLTGNISLANILFTVNTSGGGATLNAASTITALGDLTIGGTGNINLLLGNINVFGNVYLTNTAYGTGGTTTINILGSANQSLDATTIVGGQCRMPNVIINKTAGTLSFLGNISFYWECNLYCR